MNTEIDPRLCVAIERGAGDAASLILVDGRIKFARRATLDELVRRERLTVVAAAALRATAETFRPTADFAVLQRQAVGRDDEEVRLAKRIARLQEPFRGRDRLSWEWWGRFVACNSPAISIGVLEMLWDLAEGHDSRRRGPLAIDWLGRLRLAMSVTASTEVSTLKTAIAKSLSRGADDS